MNTQEITIKLTTEEIDTLLSLFGVLRLAQEKEDGHKSHPGTIEVKILKAKEEHLENGF
jgi:hypothetical protein